MRITRTVTRPVEMHAAQEHLVGRHGGRQQLQFALPGEDVLIDVIRCLGRLEDQNVARVDCPELHGELVDNDAVADLKGRFHRARRNVKGLKDERSDQEGDENRHHDDDAPLDQ